MLPPCLYDTFTDLCPEENSVSSEGETSPGVLWANESFARHRTLNPGGDATL